MSARTAGGCREGITGWVIPYNAGILTYCSTKPDFIQLFCPLYNMHKVFSNFVFSRENCNYFAKCHYPQLTTVVHITFPLILLEIMSFPLFYPHYPQDYIIFLWITFPCQGKHLFCRLLQKCCFSTFFDNLYLTFSVILYVVFSIVIYSGCMKCFLTFLLQSDKILVLRNDTQPIYLRFKIRFHMTKQQTFSQRSQV